MTTLTYTLPQTGQLNSTEDPKIVSALQAIPNWANGNIDASNFSAAAAQAVGVNQGGQTVKGAVNIAASETRTNVAYGTMPTPDQVSVVLPANGLIAVWYQAVWQESIDTAAAAAIFVGANQLVRAATTGAPVAQFANMGGGNPGKNVALSTWGLGLLSGPDTPISYSGDATTGQLVGGTTNTNGGPCYIFAAAGTYTVSVQFKASSGSVTAANRKLWVQALSFA